MPELSVFVSSYEAATAAAKSGADSICISAYFQAAKGKSVFAFQETAQIARFCHVRGIKLYVHLGGSIAGGNFAEALSLAENAQSAGADALITGDIGLLRALHSLLPEMPLHLSAEGGVHNLSMALLAKKLGATRVLLSSELPRERVCFIARNAKLETGLLGLGNLCISYRGQCHLSCIASQHLSEHNSSGCQSSCLFPYSAAGKLGIYPLSLKPCCLLGDMSSIKLSEVSAVTLDVRNMHTGLVAIFSGIAARTILSGKLSENDSQLLSKVLPKSAANNSFFLGDKGSHMLCSPEKREFGGTEFYAEAKKTCLSSELPRVLLRYFAIIKSGESVKLGAKDALGNTVAVQGTIPEPAFHKETTRVALQTQLFRIKNSHYAFESLRCDIDEGLYVPREIIEKLQKDLLAQLDAKRALSPQKALGSFSPVPEFSGTAQAPALTVSVLRASQLSLALAKRKPKMLIIPAAEAFSHSDKLLPFFENGETVVSVSLPQIIWDGEESALERQLLRASALGIKDAHISNLGHIELAAKFFPNIHGNFGLNIQNSETLDICRAQSLCSALLPFDFTYQQLDAISKCINTEIVVYGRLPLMLTESCIIKNCSGVCSCSAPMELRDKNGIAYPVFRTSGCRNLLLSPSKLFLADRQKHYSKRGIWGSRLSFTTENARECVAVIDRYLGENDYEPGGFFRGFYGR